MNYIKKSKYDHSWWGNGLLAISNISTARQKNVAPSSRLLYTFRGVLAKLASTLMNDGKVFKMCCSAPYRKEKAVPQNSSIQNLYPTLTQRANQRIKKIINQYMTIKCHSWAPKHKQSMLLSLSASGRYPVTHLPFQSYLFSLQLGLSVPPCSPGPGSISLPPVSFLLPRSRLKDTGTTRSVNGHL